MMGSMPGVEEKAPILTFPLGGKGQERELPPRETFAQKRWRREKTPPRPSGFLPPQERRLYWRAIAGCSKVPSGGKEREGRGRFDNR